MKRQTNKRAFTLIGPKDHDRAEGLWRERHLKSAFTLIELIVVMAVIGILVLLAAPKFLGYTQEARHTELITNSRELEKSSERYFMDFEDWPRLTDDAYTADEIHAFAEKIYDITGKEVMLDPAGNYYDIDYDKLSEYIKEPDNKMNYVLRNPVGKVYALDGLTQEAKIRLVAVKASSITIDATNINMVVGESKALTATIEPESASNKSIIWTSDNASIATVSSAGLVTGKTDGITTITAKTTDGNFTATTTVTVNSVTPFSIATFTSAGTTGIFGPTQAQLDTAYNGTLLAGKVTSSNGIQLWTVPVTGTYRIESFGASAGGSGAIIRGDIGLTAGTQLKILIGQRGTGTGGSGGTFVAKSDNTPLVVAGGGGGKLSSATSNANILTNGKAGAGGGAGAGGINANGGRQNSSEGASGAAGFIGNGYFYLGGDNGSATHNRAAKSFINGGTGTDYLWGNGGYGGFGGGGSGGSFGAGGGGGGYSGGGAGGTGNSEGGGGGSFNSGINQSNSVGSTGHGKVVITFIN